MVPVSVGLQMSVRKILQPDSVTGFYEPLRRQFNGFVGWDPEEVVPLTSVLAGAVSGAIGGKSLFCLHNSSYRFVECSLTGKPAVFDQGPNAGTSFQLIHNHAHVPIYFS